MAVVARRPRRTSRARPTSMTGDRSGAELVGLQRQDLVDVHVSDASHGPDRVLDDVVDARGERLRRRPARSPGTCRCAAGCGRACGSCRCRRCRWPAARRTPRRRRSRVVEVDRADDGRALGRIGDERRRPLARLGPAVERGRRRAGCASTHQSRPPLSSIQRIWSSSITSVASAGVLYVWFGGCCRARCRGRARPGRQRSLAAIRSIRSTAAGEHAASHSPPSVAKHFCGAK